MYSKRKVVTRAALKRSVARHRQEGGRIVFTNGCFDILHYGHIAYLEAAKKKGRILVVGLNSDASVRMIKGPGRPVNRQQERAVVLAALACVDYVTIFDESTPYELIKAVQPDVLVKGGDWKAAQVVGRDIVRARGGRVALIPYRKGYSTTGILNKVRRRCGR